MRITTAAGFAYDALKKDRLRSALTLLGIFLGLFTAVMILGVGKGIILEVQDLMSAFGTDKIMVMPFNFNKIFENRGSLSAFTEFRRSDINELRGITCIEDSMEMIYGTGEKVQYEDQVIDGLIGGVTESYFTSFGDYFSIERGRTFTDQESSVAVIGYSVAHDFFGEEVLPGKRLVIKNRTFTVVGTMKKVGRGSMNAEDDEFIAIPLREAQQILGKQGEIDFVMLDVREGCDLEETKGAVETILARRAGVSVDKADFSAITSAFMKKMVDDSLNVLYAGATAVGLIASLVSAIGIANTMFTSVFRRKREIGIMKAIGARKNDIIMIFMLESVMLSLFGALLGALFGTVVGMALKEFYGVPFAVDWIVVVIAVAVGIAVGVLSGILPARSAASIDAIESMRS